MNGGAAGFAATSGAREDLLGIQDRFSVECLAQILHNVHVGLGEKKRHQIVLFHAYSMFAGDRAADTYAISEYVCPGSNRFFQLHRIAKVEQDSRVHVAVPCMKDIGDCEAVLLANGRDLPKRFRDFGSRDHAILRVIRGRQTTDGSKGIFPALPK